jgi:ubiquinone/menaquinone biosynthesis C-methylase UbiE
VKPLEHEYVLPYDSATFEVLLSVDVLEHVPNHRASLAEIKRVLKPEGLFFCFFLPTKLSWTQQICRWLGDDYHDRLYTEGRVKQLLGATDLDPGSTRYLVSAAPTQEFASLSKLSAIRKDGSVHDGKYASSLLRHAHRICKRQAPIESMTTVMA